MKIGNVYRMPRWAKWIVGLLFLPIVLQAQEVDMLSDTVSELSTGLNTVWMLLAAMLVFFYAAGLCFGRSRIYPYQEHGQYSDEEFS